MHRRCPPRTRGIRWGMAGLPNIRFHDPRHTCATLPLIRGVHPKIVSEMLGHSSVSSTLDVYSHVIPGLGDAAALAMEDALSTDSDDGSVGGVGGEEPKCPPTDNEAFR
ncbi:MAG TPA: tyrosine-type recombinase/integrase [Rubrobacteraceae bacterium]|nr:tyrosine-type recombinase/integrase [Rubrobacteraceae bacterium]